ncbi:hypothetical protein H4R21_003276, partial [Coemansia helicoidea]
PSTAHHSEDEDDDDDDEQPLSSTAGSSPLAAVAGAKRDSRSSSRSSPARDKRQALAPPAPAAALGSGPTSPVALPPTSALLPRPPVRSSDGAACVALPPIGAVGLPARPPAQSVPSSPSFRPHSAAMAHGPDAARQHQQAQLAGGFGAGPFFSSDVSSIRHHLNPIAPAPFPPQAPARTLGTQSLQSTPLMRPVVAHEPPGANIRF